MLLFINLPRKCGVQEKNIRADFIFMSHTFLPESRLEAEVYKLNRFTVNLFINKGFNRLNPLVLEPWMGVL